MNISNSQETYNQELNNNGNLTHILKTEDLISVSDRETDQRQMMKKLYRRNKELQRQEEENKQQLLHAETIGMMIKYQFVYIKIENQFYILDNLFVNKQNILQFIQDSIKSVQISEQPENLLQQLIFQTSLIKIQDQKLSQLIQNKRDSQAQEFLIRLRIENEIQKNYYYQNTIQDYKEILQKTIKIKNLDIKNLQQNLKQLQNKVKNKKNIFELDKRLYSLQENKMDQVMLNQINQLELQNDQMNMKQSNEETFISQFVQEMNQMLDNHEQSTNASQEQELQQINQLNNFQQKLQQSKQKNKY